MRKPCSGIKALYITNLGILENLSQTQVLPYLEGLSMRGIRVSILSFEKKENLKNAVKVKNMKNRLENSDIDWDCLTYHNRWGNILDVFSGLIKTLRLAKRKGVDLLHARASIPIIIAWPVAKLLGRKIIYDRRGTMVGDFVDDINKKNIFSLKVFSFMLDRLDRFMVRHSDATIVLSERAKDMLEKDFHASGTDKIIESIPCCVNTEEFNDIEPRGGLKVNLDDKFVISYLGSLGTCYLLREMAVFFKMFKETVNNALFLIISHTEKRYIEGVLEKEGLITGRDYAIISLEPEEVPQHLVKSDCSVMFIKPVACKIGASPTKFAESLAAGVPVCINKNIGDMDRLIESERVGVTVEGFDETSYRGSIEKLKDLVLDKTLSSRCRRVADKYFSSEMGIDKYYKVYENVFKGGKLR